MSMMKASLGRIDIFHRVFHAYLVFLTSYMHLSNRFLYFQPCQKHHMSPQAHSKTFLFYQDMEQLHRERDMHLEI